MIALGTLLACSKNPTKKVGSSTYYIFTYRGSQEEERKGSGDGKKIDSGDGFGDVPGGLVFKREKELASGILPLMRMAVGMSHIY